MQPIFPLREQGAVCFSPCGSSQLYICLHCARVSACDEHARPIATAAPAHLTHMQARLLKLLCWGPNTKCTGSKLAWPSAQQLVAACAGASIVDGTLPKSRIADARDAKRATQSDRKHVAHGIRHELAICASCCVVSLLLLSVCRLSLVIRQHNAGADAGRDCAGTVSGPVSERSCLTMSSHALNTLTVASNSAP